MRPNKVEINVYLHIYRKVASSNMSRFEAHAGFFRLFMKGIFDPYIMSPFDKKFISYLVTRVRTLDYTLVDIAGSLEQKS